MKLTLPKLYGQKETPWGPQKLGTSGALISSEGCLLTVAAMVCCHHGKDTDPGRLNDALISVKGFYQRSKLIYGTITDLYPDITVDWTRYVDCPDTPAPLETIYQALDTRLIPLLKVDTQPTPGIQEHWVAAIGYNDADKELIVWDPWDKAEYFFVAKYGDPKTKIWRIVVYQGPLPASDPPPPNNTSERLVKVEEGLSQTKDEVAKNTRRMDELQRSLDNVSADRSILEDIQGKLGEVKETVKLNSESQATMKKELRDEIRSNVETVEARLKKLEEPPPQSSDIEVVLPLPGNWFIGKTK